jgi:hypothetical protein
MRARLIQLAGRISVAASLGCAALGQVQPKEQSYTFDVAIFATQDDPAEVLVGIIMSSWAWRRLRTHGRRIGRQLPL